MDKKQPQPGAYYISRQIDKNFPILHKLHKVSQQVAHHLVVSYVVDGWCVHELYTEDNIALTCFTVYPTWEEFIKKEIGNLKYKILKSCKLSEWHERSVRCVRRKLHSDKKAYRLLWRNCQTYADLMWKAGIKGIEFVKELFKEYDLKEEEINKMNEKSITDEVTVMEDDPDFKSFKECQKIQQAEQL